MSRIISIFTQPSTGGQDVSVRPARRGARGAFDAIYEQDKASFDKVEHVKKLFAAKNYSEDLATQVSGMDIVSSGLVKSSIEYAMMRKHLEAFNKAVGAQNMVALEVTNNQWEYLNANPVAMEALKHNMSVVVDKLDWNSEAVEARDSAVENLVEACDEVDQLIVEAADYTDGDVDDDYIYGDEL